MLVIKLLLVNAVTIVTAELQKEWLMWLKSIAMSKKYFKWSNYVLQYLVNLMIVSIIRKFRHGNNSIVLRRFQKLQNKARINLCYEKL